MSRPNLAADLNAARMAGQALTNLPQYPNLPQDIDGPVFREPWEAEAFAMALALHARGLFEWPEWAATLAAEIKRSQDAGDPDAGETYYHHWLNALEKLVTLKDVADASALERYQEAWRNAERRTRHGEPIELRPQDFSDIASLEASFEPPQS